MSSRHVTSRELYHDLLVCKIWGLDWGPVPGPFGMQNMGTGPAGPPGTRTGVLEDWS